MKQNRSLLAYLVEGYEKYQSARKASLSDTENKQTITRNRLQQVQWFLPNGGTILLVILLIVTQSVWARGIQSSTATSTNTISYQGRLADSGGSPVTGLQNMEFRLYDIPVGGTPLWEEFWTGGNAVQVSDGLFNVMLGSLNNSLTSVVQGESQLYLGVTVGTDSEMAPRVQLGSVPFSMQALTVADGSVTTNKIANAAVTKDKLADDALPQFGGSPNSYPYLVHLRHFALYMGNYCHGYVPKDPDIIGTSPECAGLDRFLAGPRFYSPSGTGYISVANNLPESNGGARWGYAHSFFLNNPASARTVTIPVHSCNDVAIYVSTGDVLADALAPNTNLVYHRFPGISDPGITGCNCSGLNPSVPIPSGPFRLTFVTRGAACTSYLTVGNASQGVPTGNWITNAGLIIDWDSLRAYLGE